MGKDTISDKDWRSLQDRARKANPKLADTLGKEATARRLAANQQVKAAKEGRN